MNIFAVRHQHPARFAAHLQEIAEAPPLRPVPLEIELWAAPYRIRF